MPKMSEIESDIETAAKLAATIREHSELWLREDHQANPELYRDVMDLRDACDAVCNAGSKVLGRLRGDF